MDLLRIAAFDKRSFISVPSEEVADALIRISSPNGRARNFVTVKMQNWQYRSIPHRIEKLHPLPAALKRCGFSFSIAHDRGHNQLRVIESRTESMHEHVP